MARYDFDYELTLGCVRRGRNDFTAQDQPILAFSTVRSHDVTQCVIIVTIIEILCYACALEFMHHHDACDPEMFGNTQRRGLKSKERFWNLNGE